MNYEEIVISAMNQHLGFSHEIQVDDKFYEHGDSLDFLEVLMLVEDVLDISIDEEEIPSNPTVKQIVDHVVGVHA